MERSSNEIHIPNLRMEYEVGDRLPLFQINAESYIAGVQRLDGTTELVAFPRRGHRNAATGWVTNDKFLIFAKKTQSISAKMYLDRGETLDIVDRHADHFQVLLRRFGREAVIRISSRASGYEVTTRDVRVRQRVEIEPPPEPEKPETQAVAAEPRRPSRKISVQYDEQGMLIRDNQGNTLVDETQAQNENKTLGSDLNPAKISFVEPEPDRSKETREKVVAELKEVVMLEIMAELRKSKDSLARDMAGSQSDASGSQSVDIASAQTNARSVSTGTVSGAEAEGATNSTPTTADVSTDEIDAVSTALATRLAKNVDRATQALEVATAEAATEAVDQHRDFRSEEPRRNPVLGFLMSNSMMFQILLLVCVVEGIMLLRYQKKSAKSEKPQASASEYFSYTSNGESVLSESFGGDEDADEEESGDLTGSLDGYGLGQVVQFFHSSGDSGTLKVKSPSGTEEFLYFQKGQVIDAEAGELGGEDAVYHILRRNHGSFVFQREDLAEREPVILQDTMSLLLEGSRLADEEGFLNE